MNPTGPAAAPPAPTSASGRGAVFVVAAASCVLPFAAGIHVVSMASGSYQIDALGPASQAFLVWWSVPLALVIASARPRRAVIVGIAAATGSLALTAVLVRPQAPDGSAHPDTYGETIATTDADVRRALDEVAPDRWRLLVETDPAPCLDRFGRERGAVYGGPTYRIDGPVSAPERARMAELLGAPDRELQGEGFGGPEELRGDEHERVVIRVATYPSTGVTNVEVVTPCLQAT